MSFLKRLFSSHYRQALSHEGAGQYREAAQRYVMAGERLQAARMNRLAARDESDPHARVDMLRRALDMLESVDPGEEDLAPLHTMMERDLADALVALVDHSGLMDRRDRSYLEEAARIYQQQQAHNEAGEAQARLGHRSKAVEAFKAAGNIGRMEEMFQHLDQDHADEDAFDRAWDAYEFARIADDPIGAIEALERCVAARPHDAGLLSRLQKLRQSMPVARRVTLRSPAGTWVLVGGEVLRLGREAHNELLLMDPSVSREHARLSLSDAGAVLEDLGSSHGTWFQDQRLEAPCSLEGQGQVRLGRDVVLQFKLDDISVLPGSLEVVGGHLKGQRFLWASALVTGQEPGLAPPWIPPGLGLHFIRGYWHVDPATSHQPIEWQGAALQQARLLRLGDELAFAGATLVVE